MTKHRVVKDFVHSSEEDFDTMGFFKDEYSVQPSLINVRAYFDFNKVLKLLKQRFPENLLEFEYYYSSNPFKQSKLIEKSDLNKNSYSFKSDNGFKFVINFESINNISNIYVKTKKKEVLTCTNASIFYHPEIDVQSSSDTLKIFNKCKLEEIHDDKTENDSLLTMILFHPMDGFYTKTFKMNSWVYSDEDLVDHYGPDIKQFHSTFIQTIAETTKGIALFHGDPGTGKTHFIRRITSDLNNAGKRVLFIPNTIFDKIGDPTFSAFLLKEFNEDVNGVVFILEDAEKILLKSDKGRSDQVTTLLNIGDGIMNDLFKIQLICTFNCKEDDIDEAILRDGRLLAKRKFEKLSIENAQSLVNKLGVTYIVTEPMSLASVFALKTQEAKTILIS